VPFASGQAQERFKNEVGPQLHRVGEFALCRNQPGTLIYSDGVVDPVAFGGRDGYDYSILRRLTARRLRVSFEPVATGTTITIRGHAERTIRDAINRLGEPGQWPQG
jgi:hypothetical protein